MTCSHSKSFWVLLFCVIIFTLPAHSEMIINGGRTFAEHNREGGSFIGDGYDWSGVSIGVSYKGTMISPSYFLTADHQKTAVGGTLTFRNPGGIDYNYTVDSYTSPLTYTSGSTTYNSDLRLGKLTTSLNPLHNLAYYPIVPDGQVFVGEETFMYGRSDYVGKNAPDFLAFATSGGSVGGMTVNLYYDNLPDEAYMQSGDSSGPSFVIRNDELAVLGIHWAISNATSSPTYGVDYNIDSYAPYYIDQMNARMSGDGEQVTLALLIPEPASILILALGAVCIFRRRR